MLRLIAVDPSRGAQLFLLLHIYLALLGLAFLKQAPTRTQLQRAPLPMSKQACTLTRNTPSPSELEAGKVIRMTERVSLLFPMLFFSAAHILVVLLMTKACYFYLICFCFSPNYYTPDGSPMLTTYLMIPSRNRVSKRCCSPHLQHSRYTLALLACSGMLVTTSLSQGVLSHKLTISRWIATAVLDRLEVIHVVRLSCVPYS